MDQIKIDCTKNNKMNILGKHEALKKYVRSAISF